jgi:hypothetical protein
VISRSTAEHRRDVGMQRSLFSANRKTNGWSDAARAVLENYIVKHPRQSFIGEDVVEYAKAMIDSPPDGRAWGGVFCKAAADGLIKRTGEYRKARSSNLSPKPVWVAA